MTMVSGFIFSGNQSKQMEAKEGSLSHKKERF